MKKTYHIDPSNSKIDFSVKHMMFAKVYGSFDEIQGEIFYDQENILQSSVIVNIETNSIDTRDAQRDSHLKSADFFDIEKYPRMTFHSTHFERGRDGLIILGNLTVHGVTKPVRLETQAPVFEDRKMRISGKANLKRKDFGLSWNAALEAGGILVGDDINITFNIQSTNIPTNANW